MGYYEQSYQRFVRILSEAIGYAREGHLSTPGLAWHTMHLAHEEADRGIHLYELRAQAFALHCAVYQAIGVAADYQRAQRCS